MRMALGVIAAVLLSRGCWASPQPLTVAVWDYAGLPDKILLPAVEFAERAFRTAGIEAVWTICRAHYEDCALPSDGRYLAMLVMPTMVQAPPGVSGDVAGLAMVGGPRAWAFYDVAAATAAKTGRPLPLVLGCILVHEIAHVLGLAHRETGIMRARLTTREVDHANCGQIFDSLEARQLNAGASRLAASLDRTYVAAIGQ